MDKVRKHFEEEAHEFDETIRRLVPRYEEMLDALVLALPFERTAEVNVLDLGCGTGTVARRVRDVLPNAGVTCVDIAQNMLDLAKGKLGENVRYQLADFRSYEFDQTYDAIVSSLALHHLETDEEKKGFYGQIFEALRPGGVFCNADVVLGSTEHLQEEYMERWKGFMRRQVSEQEIEEYWLPKYHSEDHPAPLTSHFGWLKEAGFVDVEVIWKHYNFAVYGGMKIIGGVYG